MTKYVAYLCIKLWFGGVLMHIFVAAIFLLYAKLEEEHGLARHAMSVYDRATKAVPPEEQYQVSTAVILFSV